MLIEGDYYKISSVWLFRTFDEQVNVFHVGLLDTGVLSQDFIREDIAGWLTDLYSGYVGRMSNALVHDRVEIFNVTTGNPEIPLAPITALNGGSSGEAMPPQTCAEVWARTETSRHIGRKYLPTSVEGEYDGTQWGATMRSSLSGFATKWKAGFTGTHGVTVLPGVWDASAGILRPIVYAVYASTPRTQRRRRVGVGR